MGVFDPDQHVPEPSSDWWSLAKLAILTVVVTFAGFGGWAAIARLDSAVVASGAISNESNRRTVQHLEGGIVREILVREGSKVQAGDVLVRLDPTRSEATGDLYRKQLAVALAAEARLTAQRDMATSITFSPEVLALAGDPQVAATIADNRRQFESRRETLQGNLNIVDQQILQVEKELQSTEIDRKTAREQLATVDQELPGLRSLFQKGLVALNRVTALEREDARLRGVIESSGVALKKGADKIAELNARRKQLSGEYRQEAAEALPDTGKTISDLRQQIIIAEDSIKRIDIRAPVSGSVQGQKVFTVGGVLKPGDPIMDVVPEGDTLVIRGRVSPIDIDRIRIGQKTEIRLPQFIRFHSALIQGTVRNISRDTLPAEDGKTYYFAVEATVERSTVPKDILDKLTAGMNVDLIMPTGERTALQYILAPFADRLYTSMRER